jgi:hypothetical protein
LSPSRQLGPPYRFSWLGAAGAGPSLFHRLWITVPPGLSRLPGDGESRAGARAGAGAGAGEAGTGLGAEKESWPGDRARDWRLGPGRGEMLRVLLRALFLGKDRGKIEEKIIFSIPERAQLTVHSSLL